SIIAYYLSEYDMDAVVALGYKSRNEAFKQISISLDHDNNYLKLRRDEFDSLPTSKSTRRGWANRPAIDDVVELAEQLHQVSFETLTNLVQAIMKSYEIIPSTDITADYGTSELNEEELENLINHSDTSASIKLKLSEVRYRSYNPAIIKYLKIIYKNQCQICGRNPFPEISNTICEAHHIEYFSTSQNNSASNIIILCPNHHRLIHLYNPLFHREKLEYQYPDGQSHKVQLNIHLS
ncbi:MAG TPA: HNH endonuclease signature motif containing protein, partial [Alphaproteobacteria bacterium]|nr:HNH endonuclease signature motif containing protein [Alphaproteobacteria bacterium]